MKKVQQTKALHRKKSRNTTRKYFNWYCLKYSPAVTAIWLANCVDLNCFVPCGSYVWGRDRVVVGVRVRVSASVTVYLVVCSIYGEFHLVDTVTATSAAHPTNIATDGKTRKSRV